MNPVDAELNSRKGKFPKGKFSKMHVFKKICFQLGMFSKRHVFKKLCFQSRKGGQP